MIRWKITGLIATVIIILVIPLYILKMAYLEGNHDLNFKKVKFKFVLGDYKAYQLDDEFFTRQIDGNYTGTSSPVATCSGPLAFEGKVIA